MSSISWFRRFHTRDLASPRVPAINSEPKPNTTMVGIRLDNIMAASVNFCRQFHMTGQDCQQIKPQTAANYLRNKYINVINENMDEDQRSKMKYLNSKGFHGEMPTAKQSPRSKAAFKVPDDDEDVKSIASSKASSGSQVSQSETISITKTRNETAREFVRPIDYKITELKEEPRSRVTCPKPTSMSPYSRHAEESDSGVQTLKNHYTKVLLNPVKSFGVTFPATPKSSGVQEKSNKSSSKRFDQYMGTSGQTPVMTPNVNVKPINNTTQNRSMQSDSSARTSMEASYNQLKKANNTRYLEMCSASDDQVFVTDPKVLKKKHVEMVKMEVIKLDKTLRKSKRDTDIRQELEHVLQEALAQSKVYENNVLHAHRCEDIEQEEEEAPKRRNSFMSGVSYGRSSHAHASVVLDKDKLTAQPKVSFDNQTRNRVRSHSGDGKNCYSVLKSETTPKESVSEDNEGGSLNDDVSMALTDLNDYDDGSECASNKIMVSSTMRAKTPSGGSVKSNSTSENPRLSKLEKDIQIAQRQHNQKILDVFEIVKGVKAK